MNEEVRVISACFREWTERLYHHIKKRNVAETKDLNSLGIKRSILLICLLLVLGGAARQESDRSLLHNVNTYFTSTKLSGSILEQDGRITVERQGIDFENDVRPIFKKGDEKHTRVEKVTREIESDAGLADNWYNTEQNQINRSGPSYQNSHHVIVEHDQSALGGDGNHGASHLNDGSLGNGYDGGEESGEVGEELNDGNDGIDDIGSGDGGEDTEHGDGGDSGDAEDGGGGGGGGDKGTGGEGNEGVEDGGGNDEYEEIRRGEKVKPTDTPPPV